MKNAEPDKYSYSEYGIRFDSRSLFIIPNFDWDKNVIIFGVDNSSSTHTNNRKKYIFVFGEGPMQGLVDSTITTEAKYSINLYKIKKEILSLHYNGSNSFFCANEVKIYKFKAKDSEIKLYPLLLETISKDFTVNNIVIL